MTQCPCTYGCLRQILECCGKEIFWSAIAAIITLLLIVIALAIAICCICYRKRKSSASADIESKEVKEKSGKKGDAFRMVEIEGEVPADGENKTNTDDREEDTKVEIFAEAMYATVDCTQDQSSSNSQAKQTSNTDQMTDGDNYDIITHVAIEEDDSALAGNKSSSAPGKSTGKAAKKSKEKKTAPETAVTKVEYSIPDIVHKQKKQNARKASTNLEQSASGGGVSASLEYNTLLHVTSSHTQRLSMTPPSEYSSIAQQDGRRNGSTSDINGRQRGRTRSPPEEPPPPLPPPFVDEETPTISSANTGIQSSALKQQNRNDIGGLCGNAGISVAKEDLTLYDDPATSEPQQEMYMNIGKR